MRWRMAAKIAAMNMPPRRIALVALVVLLLVGGGAWWWQGQARSVTEPGFAKPVASSPKQVARSLEPRLEADGLQLLADLQAAEAAMKPCETDMMALRKTRLEALAKDTDVDARLTHALMSAALGGGAGPDATSRLLADLAQSTPENPDVAWYQAMYCKKSSSVCDRQAAIDRYLVLEPDNMVGWLMALDEAGSEDEGAQQALLERAAYARFLDGRNGDSFIRLYEAMHDLPLPASCRPKASARLWTMLMKSGAAPTAADMAAMSAMAVVSAEVMPYRRVVEMCQPSSGSLPEERIDVCKRVLARLADDGTLLGQALGTQLMVSLTADSEDGSQWGERYRQSKWIWNAMSRDIRFDRETMMKRMTDGEVPAFQAELRARNKWPPPADWLPDDEHSRSLILTGKPPPEKNGK